MATKNHWNEEKCQRARLTAAERLAAAIRLLTMPLPIKGEQTMREEVALRVAEALAALVGSGLPAPEFDHRLPTSKTAWFDWGIETANALGLLSGPGEVSIWTDEGLRAAITRALDDRAT